MDEGVTLYVKVPRELAEQIESFTETINEGIGEFVRGVRLERPAALRMLLELGLQAHAADAKLAAEGLAAAAAANKIARGVGRATRRTKRAVRR